jgi:hypothetical protein
MTVTASRRPGNLDVEYPSPDLARRYSAAAFARP